jgi:hypothetical protein
VPAGLVEEELERIGRDRGRGVPGRLDGVLLGLRPQLDVTLFERAPKVLEVLPLDVVLEGECLELPLLQEASLGGLVEQRLDVGKLKQLVQNVPLSYLSWSAGGSPKRAESAPGPLASVQTIHRNRLFHAVWRENSPDI